MAKNAWYGQAAKATKGSGKNIRSAYEDFNDFFDYDTEIQNLFQPTERRRNPKRVLKIINHEINDTKIAT